jgi:hypothetical protein
MKPNFVYVTNLKCQLASLEVLYFTITLGFGSNECRNLIPVKIADYVTTENGNLMKLSYKVTMTV